MINRRRIVRSPRFETAPSFCLPPVDFCSGVSPSQAAKSRPAGNPSAAGTSAVIAVEAALRKDIAVFHQVPAKSVDALGALTHQEIARAEHDAVRLLLFGLDRNEAHAWPLRRFTDGLCIGRIVLLPLDERLDVDQRDQAHMMAQLSDL